MWCWPGIPSGGTLLGENDELIGRKVRAILDGGLECILCCGETLDQRLRGETHQVNERQVRAALAGVPGDLLSKLTIAYEPVWGDWNRQGSDAG